MAAITKRNAVTIIVGCGRLGAHTANVLSGEGGGVVIIDNMRDEFHKLSPAFDGMTLTGDATDLSVLAEAGVERAYALIAVTGHENTNIMIAQIAKVLYNVPRVITRLYEPELECIYKEFGIETISPLLLSTKEIESLLGFSEAEDKR